MPLLASRLLTALQLVGSPSIFPTVAFKEAFIVASDLFNGNRRDWYNLRNLLRIPGRTCTRLCQPIYLLTPLCTVIIGGIGFAVQAHEAPRQSSLSPILPMTESGVFGAAATAAFPCRWFPLVFTRHHPNPRYMLNNRGPNSGASTTCFTTAIDGGGSGWGWSCNSLQDRTVPIP